MLKTVTKWAVFFYALIIIALGLIGYFQAGSVASAVSGGSFGILLLISTLFMFMNKKGGFYASLLLTALLAGVFAYRYTISNGSLPALMAVLSGAMLIYLLAQIGHWKK